MLHHVSVGVTDMDRAARFYDLVMAALGYKRVMEFMPFAIAYGETTPELWIGLPHDQQPASVGNGTHIALEAKNRRAVKAFHEAALAAGGRDDGGPGPRPEYTPQYFGAFVRDPDGNKLEAMLMVVEETETAGRGAGRRGGSKRGGKGKGQGKGRRAAATRGAKGKGAGKAKGKRAGARGAARGGARGAARGAARGGPRGGARGGARGGKAKGGAKGRRR